MRLQNKLLDQLLKTAVAASKAGGAHALSYFENAQVKVDRKGDQTPVTQADRESEELIRARIQKNFPGHSIVGEEYGEQVGKSPEFKWWIDPIDGTFQFIRGLKHWGCVVGLEYDNEVVAGCIYLPAAKLLVSARLGGGCKANNSSCRVSKTSKIEKSLILHSSLKRMKRSDRSKALQVISLSEDDRGIGDCFGHCLVAQGKADAFLDLSVQPYDVSAVKICVQEAGGHFLDLQGGRSIYKGKCMSSNSLLSKKIEDIFQTRKA